MPTYLLDILIEEAQLLACCRSIRTPIWIRIRADGLCQPFDTRAVAACARPSWKTAVRLVLDLPRLEGAHFKATLNSSGYVGEVLPIAASQVRLTGLPVGRPGRFVFPLQSAQDFGVQAAMLSVTASISEVALRPRPALEPAGPVWGWGTQQPVRQEPEWTGYRPMTF
jgi:hypothetical protein